MTWASLTGYAQTQPSAVYAIDAARSKITVSVSRGGFLKLAGHDHEIAAKTFSGEIRFNPVNIKESAVRLSIVSGSLVVVNDPGESGKDRQEVQATMQGEKVLNIKEFPEILFRSTGVNIAVKSGEVLSLTGRLSLHGIEKEIVFPVNIHPENNMLRAAGMVAIAQTDFGIKPITAALGTIRVKDQVRIGFDILAERINP
jgi:polyisoprenoid-binding protein YceI